MIEQFISKAWALEPRFHEVQAALMLRRLSGGLSPDAFEKIWAAERKKHSPMLGFVDDQGVYRPWDMAQGKAGGVCIIPIIGSMSRYGGLCSYGTEDIASWIIEANAMANVSSIVLNINSPGGEVDGTELLGDVVKHSQKPVVSYIAGMGASAAYWVGSQAREVVMESKTTSEAGSIGVLAMHVDASQFYEKEGYKVTIIRSEGSEDKALFNSVEPLSPELKAAVKAELTVIKGTFHGKVKEGRPGISDEVFSGKMYNGKEALQLGLADRIGYLGDAVRRADFLARKAGF